MALRPLAVRQQLVETQATVSASALTASNLERTTPRDRYGAL